MKKHPNPKTTYNTDFRPHLSHTNPPINAPTTLVADQIEIIAKQVPEGTNIWIDAETKLRSNNDRVFNLDKVELFLMNAKPYVIEEK